jgi:hypothetical protein
VPHALEQEAAVATASLTAPWRWVPSHRRRSVDMVGSILHVGSQARVVLDESPGGTARRVGDGSTDMTSVPITPSENEEPENVALPSLLRHPVSVAPPRQLERTRQEHDQPLAWRLQDILSGCGLTQAHFSVAVSHVFHVPQVVSVVVGPPVGLDIHILPGQTPDSPTTIRNEQPLGDHLGTTRPARG